MNSTICLNMIVKDEAHVIRRCLDSVRPFIDSWVIVDTGSTDGTQDIIRNHFKDVPGALFERPWKSFGHNRSEAIKLAGKRADYLFMIDADDELVLAPDFRRPLLTANCYSLQISHLTTRYWRPSLVSTALDWKYVGVLHEYLDADAPHTIERLNGAAIQIHIEGARGKNLSLREKYAKDAAILEQGLVDEPENSRYVFYLAQSYRDAGQLEKSLQNYQRRATMRGWAEEVWYSLFEAANLSAQLNLDFSITTQRYLDAYQARPQRAEPLVRLARLYREKQHYALAHLFASKAISIPVPDDILFIDTATYDWAATDEFAVSSYWIGNYAECARACEKLLNTASLPYEHLARVTENQNLALKALGKSGKALPWISLAQPGYASAAVPAHKPAPAGDTLCDVFSNIYANDIWDGGSGPGSAPESVGPYLSYLRNFLVEHNIRSIVDCGCGDWQFMKQLDLSGIDYTGIDIVPSVVEANRKAHAKENVRFVCANFGAFELPAADLVICKDVLQHLPNETVGRFCAQIHKFRYALVTNDIGENSARDTTLRSNPYHFARIDLTAPPFCLKAQTVCTLPGGKVTLLVTETGQFKKAPPADAPNRTVPSHTEGFSSANTNRSKPAPKVLLAILAKQKEATLPLYLRSIEALDYPKSAIVLYIRTNNNTDRTAEILRAWVERVGASYASVEFDEADVAEQIQNYGIHEWNSTRFRVLGFIRQVSLQKALNAGCDFYFVADVDNFVRPNTLRDLVALNLPIVGPLLRHEAPDNPYSNYHHEIDANGYYRDSEEYYWLLHQRIRGVAEVKVIHCTYLVRSDAIPHLYYDDGSMRFEYVVFSDSARRAGIPQYLDTRQIYGYLTLDESTERSEQLVGPEIDAALGCQQDRSPA